jgi:hypothetical protein
MIKQNWNVIVLSGLGEKALSFHFEECDRVLIRGEIVDAVVHAPDRIRWIYFYISLFCSD